jgi:Raf kinase inhibitor-like YbhB/YbcL family protein
MVLALLVVLGFAGSAAAFTLSSPDVGEGAALAAKQVLNGYGCTGGNVSPKLAWSDPPAGTKSFALTVYDPDAPTESGWWHWVVFNIPASAASIPAGAGAPDSRELPAGSVQSRTDFGAPGYGGACPPAGDKPHRYIFTLYALDVERFDLKPDASAALVSLMLGKHALAKASITAKYGR